MSCGTITFVWPDHQPRKGKQKKEEAAGKCVNAVRERCQLTSDSYRSRLQIMRETMSVRPIGPQSRQIDGECCVGSSWATAGPTETLANWQEQRKRKSKWKPMGKGSLELPGFYRSAPQLLLLLLYIHRDESSLFVGCRDSLGDWLSNQRERERESELGWESNHRIWKCRRKEEKKVKSSRTVRRKPLVENAATGISIESPDETTKAEKRETRTWWGTRTFWALFTRDAREKLDVLGLCREGSDGYIACVVVSEMCRNCRTHCCRSDAQSEE